MVEVAGGRLRFLVKAPGLVTHERRLDTEAIDPFLAYIQPFAEAGVLAGVLFQFPQAFPCEPSSLDHLSALSDRFADVVRVAEFRRSGWDSEGTTRVLHEGGWSIAGVDQPRLVGLSASLTAPVPSVDGLAVIRFHGRNSAMWHEGDARTRYEYSYSAAELNELATSVRETSDKGATTLAFFNNHARGLAAENADQLVTLLNLERPPRGAVEMDLFS
jgi:uncharacterized protein YecE (DUF72 family)